MECSALSTREVRLSAFLRSELGLSHSLINRLKVQKAIFVNGELRFTNYIVRPGDRVSVIIEEEDPAYPAEPGELRILYEDEAVIALDKPAGILIHPSRSRNRGTLANFLSYYYRETGQHCAVHPVSRLDRDTYGVVLFAKNAHTHALLEDAHMAGKLKKIYEASVFGSDLPDSGLIDAPILRLSPMGMLRAVGEGGQKALTEYRVLERRRDAALLQLRPLTGRTHQLRVHMAHIGHPILGDPQYCSEASKAYSDSFDLPWQQLCARSLTFPHPITGEEITLSSQRTVFLPEDPCSI